MLGQQTAADRMDHIPFSGIREIFEECDRLEAAGEDVVHLEIGRPDFDTPKPIKDAAVSALDSGHVHYTSNYGISELRETIAAKFDRDNDIAYDPDQEVIVTTGATEAILVSVFAFVGQGDEVLVPNPSWTYAPSVRMAGGTPVSYSLDPETGFQPDLSELRENVSDRTELLIVNSPQNPTGGVVDEDRIDTLAEFAVENDLVVLSDEIYEKILYDDSEHHSLAAHPELYDRTISVNGVSKAYSMTGWRLGYLGAPEELIDPIIRVRQYTTTCAPSLSQHAAVRAIGSGLHEPMVEAFADRRDRLLERLDRIPGMDCPVPSGAFYAFPTLPEGYEDENEFVWSLLREKNVAMVPGSVFGSNGNGRLRIAYSNSVERIDEAFDRIEAWLADQ
ncbi:pyridoxal phosphate-dependent aminotransferase [Halostella sp. PRR32]|uniref:pyridoxal phosphate-dependent aminotransferase n=1 Tax=Halostella sp. PRR32 TaxID=3098147 RepID=UPI002B1D296E|nr:pyridoxal phosphate-dependent aminotransferase [Halostella sp. PRR32]